MKRFILIMGALFVALSTSAMAGEYRWKPGYGHWNSMAMDIESGEISNGDVIKYRSALPIGHEDYWSHYMVLRDGVLVNTMNDYQYIQVANQSERKALAAAHYHGYTGSGISAIVTSTSDEKPFRHEYIGYVAPDINVSFVYNQTDHDVSISRDSNPTDTVVFNHTGTDYMIKTGKVAVVWDKFDTLSASEVEGLLDNNNYNLAAALSPIQIQ